MMRALQKLTLLLCTCAYASEDASSKASCREDEDAMSWLQLSGGQKTEENEMMSPWCLTKPCKVVIKLCRFDQKCCDLAKVCALHPHKPPTPGPTALEAIQQAWEGDGFLVSAWAGTDPNRPIEPLSNLNAYTMRTVYRNFGIVFNPDPVAGPPIKCQFPEDANTDRRWKYNKPQNQCGLQFNGNQQPVQFSGLCSDNPPNVNTADEYVAFFGPLHDGDQPRYDSCRFTAGETNLMMKSQQELYVYTYDRNPAKADYSNFFGYNEVIISALDFGTMVTGFFWAHEGGFQDKLTASDLAEIQAVCAQSLQVANVRPVSLLGEASTKSGRVESRAIPQEWQDALKSGALPIFEMIGFHANSSPPTRIPASYLSSVVDVIKGNQPPSTGAEVIREVTPEARSQIVKVCAP